MGMELDSVQNDVIHINRAMKDATLDSSSIKEKAVVLEKSLQEIGIVRAIRSSESRSAAIEMPVLCDAFII
ncbi:hypothetical protein C2845_PM06G27560 [Panicum miliaceum]|uniref:Uncharacterized protein n=1 Tax=Panicum miliaceum TaxID=4540 RepID=A0A3L6R8A4_PANMI|nr:hypothetical protein C2845_PM06G27560 [Panicum miliaceum]